MPRGIAGDTWVRNREDQIMRIDRDTCTGLVIDIQERLYPHMERKEDLLKNSLVLITGLQFLNIPIIFTEQYPKGLGETLEQIKQALNDSKVIEKIAFSCCDEPAFSEILEQSLRHTVIICGIEAHVCVLQTVLDLVSMDFLPVVVSDCVSSRNRNDKEVALERMRSEGAMITTTESILFELTRKAGTIEFKSISRLIK
jgi:nicotinamidase-related amidase